jgi:regulator of sigma E protease
VGLTLLATLIVLGVLIFVHELGHFLAAKSVGIAVERFSLGLGPKVWGFRRGETEYVLSALPLGGYVRMAGLDEAELLEGGRDRDRAPSPRDFDAKPLWARAWVVSAGVLMNLAFAFLVFFVALVAFGEPVDPTTRVRIVGADTVPGATALRSVPDGARLVSVAGRPVHSWNDVVAGWLEAPAGPVELRFADAPPVRVVLPRERSARLRLLQALQPLHEPVVGAVQPGSPAARAGLRPGDRILMAAEQPVHAWADFERIVRAHPGRPLALVVQRGSDTLRLQAVPRVERETGPNLERVVIGRLGVVAAVGLQRRAIGPVEGAARAAEATAATIGAVAKFLADLVTGQASLHHLGGPIAIGQLSGEAARFGLEAFLRFLGFISVNLAVLNLLPIPVLDGGHLLFLGIEALRGRPVSARQRLRWTQVGMAFVILLMLLAFANDLARLFG